MGGSLMAMVAQHYQGNRQQPSHTTSKPTAHLMLWLNHSPPSQPQTPAGFCRCNQIGIGYCQLQLGLLPPRQSGA